MKEPKDINDAVFEVVNFLEITKRPRRPEMNHDRRHRQVVRMVKGYSSDETEDTDCSDNESENEDYEEHRVARAPVHTQKKGGMMPKGSNKPKPRQEMNKPPPPNNVMKSEPSVQKSNKAIEELIRVVRDSLAGMQGDSQNDGQSGYPRQNSRFTGYPRENRPFTGYQMGNRPSIGYPRENKPLIDGNWRQSGSYEDQPRCFRCDQPGHFSRDCPQRYGRGNQLEGKWNQPWNSAPKPEGVAESVGNVPATKPQEN